MKNKCFSTLKDLKHLENDPETLFQGNLSLFWIEKHSFVKNAYFGTGDFREKRAFTVLKQWFKAIFE